MGNGSRLFISQTASSQLANYYIADSYAIPLKVATFSFSADCDGSTLVLALSGCPLVWGHPARDGLVQASRLVAVAWVGGKCAAYTNLTGRWFVHFNTKEALYDPCCALRARGLKQERQPRWRLKLRKRAFQSCLLRNTTTRNPLLGKTATEPGRGAGHCLLSQVPLLLR